MGINGSEVQLLYSCPSSLSGGVDPGTPQRSLGLFVSTTAFSTGISHLFNSVTADENASEKSAYRCFFIANNNPDTMLTGLRVWITSTSQDVDVAIALDPYSPSPIHSPIPQASKTNNQFVAPYGVSFVYPTSNSDFLYIGNIAPGYCRALWIRRSSHMTKAARETQSSVIIASD